MAPKFASAMLWIGSLDCAVHLVGVAPNPMLPETLAEAP